MHLQKKPIKCTPGQNLERLYVRTHRCRVSTCTTKGVNRLIYSIISERREQKSSSPFVRRLWAFHFSYFHTYRGIIKMCTLKAGGCVWSLCASLDNNIRGSGAAEARGEGPARYIYLALHLHTATNTPTITRASSSSSKQQPTIKPSAWSCSSSF